MALDSETKALVEKNADALKAAGAAAGLNVLIGGVAAFGIDALTEAAGADTQAEEGRVNGG